MSERLPLPKELLGGRSRLPGVDPHVNGVAHRLLDLADRGDYLDAAEQAAELLRGPDDDVRLIAVYLVGLFVERGPTALPEILASVARLTDPPTTSAIDSTIQWLFRAISDRVAFHTQRRDERWDAWLREVTPAHIDEIARRSQGLIATFEGRTTLSKLARWAEVKLGPAAARVAKVEAAEATEATEDEAKAPPSAATDPRKAPGWDEPDSEDERASGPRVEQGSAFTAAPDDEFSATALDELDDDELDDDELDDDELDDDELDDDGPPFVQAGQRGPPQLGAHAVVEFDSPAFIELRTKLRGFEAVLARGELDKAAVIARDVQASIDSFDPIIYLPTLFSRYFKLLRHCVHDLELHWSDDSAASRVLDQLYRADLDGFIND